MTKRAEGWLIAIIISAALWAGIIVAGGWLL